MGTAGGKSKRKHPEKYKKQYHRVAKSTKKSWEEHLANHPNDEKNKLDIAKARTILRESK